MQFKKWNITVKDTYVAHQAFLGLDKKPNPQFQSQKPKTLSTPCTHQCLQQLRAPTRGHCRNAVVLLLCDVSVAWCAWRTATASSILQQRAQGGEKLSCSNVGAHCTRSAIFQVLTWPLHTPTSKK